MATESGDWQPHNPDLKSTGMNGAGPHFPMFTDANVYSKWKQTFAATFQTLGGNSVMAAKVP